jgi:uncharacterized protein YigE (DUF2233 family)
MQASATHLDHPARAPRWLAIALTMTIAPNSLFAAECAPFEFQNTRATVCHVDTRLQRLQLFHSDDQGRPLKYFSAVNRLLKARGERLAFAMNAGMYHSDYAAVGLLIIEGQQMRPLNLASDEGNFFLKPNGVFLVGDAGARVIESSRFASLDANVRIATQSGPLLVIDGALHPAFRPDSSSRLIRNGVGVLSDHEVVFAISDEPVTFHEFAVLFRNGLGCKDALFLDATVSSFYSVNLDRADVRAPLGPIIGVTEPLPAL